MKKKEISIMIVCSLLITAMIVIWQDIDDLLLAVVTFLIVICLVSLARNDEHS